MDALKLKDALSLVRLDPPDWSECCCCGRRTTLEWCVIMHNGDWGLLCGECGWQLQKQRGEVP